MLFAGKVHFNVLERGLDAAALRQRVIANNIANVDTPRFKRSEVQFEQMLAQTLRERHSSFIGKRTDERHLYIGQAAPIPAARLATDMHSAMNNNNNNVDIDQEMSLLAKNQLRYNVMIDQLNHEMKQLRIAIDGRGS